jgi:hypothetical protein
MFLPMLLPEVLPVFLPVLLLEVLPVFLPVLLPMVSVHPREL